MEGARLTLHRVDLTSVWCVFAANIRHCRRFPASKHRWKGLPTATPCALKKRKRFGLGSTSNETAVACAVACARAGCFFALHKHVGNLGRARRKGRISSKREIFDVRQWWSCQLRFLQAYAKLNTCYEGIESGACTILLLTPNSPRSFLIFPHR